MERLGREKTGVHWVSNRLVPWTAWAVSQGASREG
jgi:hypothetical protein